jgi:hypothetical protein
MSKPTPVDLVQPGWTSSVSLTTYGLPAQPIRALRYPDGSIGIEHRCKLVDDGRQLVIAPRLTPGPDGHRITNDDPLTIMPSVLCPDCGLHGFITNGRWEDSR